MGAWVLMLVTSVLGVGLVFGLNPFPQSRRIDAFVVAVLFAACGSAAAIAAWIWPEGMRGTLLYATTGILPGTVIAISTVVQRRRLRWQVDSVLDPRFGAEGLASLRAYLDKKKPLQRAQDARRAAWVLAMNGSFEDAATVLGDVPIDEVHQRWSFERAVHLNDLAAYRIRLGRTDEAREALDAVKTMPANLKPVIGAKRALLAALTGAPDEALSTLEKVTLPPRSPHHVVRLLARAHALATRDEAGAKKALRELAAIEPDWLKRASTPDGPATALAAAVAAERDAPYR